ncbi:putative heat shock protein 70 HSP70 interacting protein, partial [Operophtera brumata]
FKTLRPLSSLLDLVRPTPDRGSTVEVHSTPFGCEYTISKVSIYCRGLRETAIVRYKTADDKAYDLALVYSNAEHWSHLKPAVFADNPAEKDSCLHVEIHQSDPFKCTVFISVNDFVDSGGPIYRIRKPSRVEVVAIIVSNAKTHTGACYPYINMAVPAAAFTHLIVLKVIILNKAAKWHAKDKFPSKNPSITTRSLQPSCRAERQTERETPGVHLLLRVPESDVDKIKQRERRLYWPFGNIYFRILEGESGNASDKGNAPTDPASRPPEKPESEQPECQLHQDTMDVVVDPPTTSKQEFFLDVEGSGDSESCLNSSPIRDS